MSAQRSNDTVTTMAQDRETLAELEGIFVDFKQLGDWPDTQPEKLRERLAAVHRQLRVQFAQRYGERP